MIGRTRWHLREVASTQEVAFALARLGAPHGTVVAAEYQHAGRGRLDRVWQAPAGSSLTFSVILRPTWRRNQLGSLSLAVADSLATTFASLVPGEVAIKWPNDVLIDGEKVSGILMQTRMLDALIAVVGIGINVCQTRSQLPEGATSLALAAKGSIDRAEQFDDVLTMLDHTIQIWRPTLPPEMHRRIESRLYHRGSVVQLTQANGSISGTILGITPQGALRLWADDSEQVITTGEILRGPRPAV